MSKRVSLVGLYSFAVLSFGTVLWACRGPGDLEGIDSETLAQRLVVLSRDNQIDLKSDARVETVVSTIRQRGPTGLDALLLRHDEMVANPESAKDGSLARMELLVEKVAAQRFASRSRLFWYTSLEEAQEEASRTGRPILSLRLLGRLDEELSCANSRFFRTTLYPDPLVSQQLRERFVLHWKPVRDVPVMTIDFGDGRFLRQPITGNSLHMVLNSEGEPIEAMPGLVSPAEFAGWLQESVDLFDQLGNVNDDRYWQQVATHHRDRAARRRSESSMTIGVTENVEQLNPLDRRWAELAASKYPVVLSVQSQELINKLQPAAEDAMPLAVYKAFVETPALRMARESQLFIGRDTAFNLHGLQTKLDDWFGAKPVRNEHSMMSYDELTERIYSEVFLMPLDDPWLGLSPDDRYTALENGGRVESIAATGVDAR